jgi:predicted HicB family RNase H-like nuclease
MMISGKKRLFYSDNLLVKIDPGLRAELAAAAERERMSMSELVRRGVRAALAGHTQHTSAQTGCSK